MIRIRLNFTYQDKILELSSTEFTSEINAQRHVCVRGNFVHSRATGTFPWSSGVRACAFLLVRSRMYSEMEEARLRGHAKSAAAALDSALSKCPQWLCDMFGCDSDGRPFARRIFQRINPERKRLGPVQILVNDYLMPREAIDIYLNDLRCTDKDDLLRIANELSKHWPIKDAALHKPEVEESIPLTIETKQCKELLVVVGIQGLSSARCDALTKGLCADLSSFLDTTIPTVCRNELLSSSEGIQASVCEREASHLLTIQTSEAASLLSVRFTLSRVPSREILWSSDLGLSEYSRGLIQSSIQKFFSPKGRVAVYRHFSTAIEAREMYLRAVGLCATNSQADFGVARTISVNLIDAFPNDPSIEGLYSFILWRSYFMGWGGGLSELQESRVRALSAIARDPYAFTPTNSLIRACWDLGSLGEAVHHALRLHMHMPGSIESQLVCARAFLNAGKAESALGFLEKVFIKDPVNLTARKMEVWCNLMKEEFEIAAGLYDIIHCRLPDDSNTCWAGCMALVHMEEFEKAKEWARRVLRRQPRDFILWVLLSHIWALHGNESHSEDSACSALLSCDFALKENNMNLRARCWRVQSLARLHLEAEAREELKNIFALAPENPYIKFRLSHCLAEMGDFESCLDLMREAVCGGFISPEITWCETATSLAPIKHFSEFHEILRSANALSDSLIVEIRKKMSRSEAPSLASQDLNCPNEISSNYQQS